MTTPKTDQDESRQVGDRLAPPTTPDRETIKQDRAAVDQPHGDSGAQLTPEEEAAADRTKDSADADVAEHYEDMVKKGAAQEGEGKPGV